MVPGNRVVASAVSFDRGAFMNDPIRQSLRLALRSVGLGLSLGSLLFLPQPLRAESEKEAIQKVVSGYYDALGRDLTEAASYYGEPAMIVLPTNVLANEQKSGRGSFSHQARERVQTAWLFARESKRSAHKDAE